MAERFRDLKVSEYLKLAWPFVVIAGLGVAGHIAGQWFPYHLLAVLADALIVAGLVGVGLELFATRFLIDKVANNLAAKLVGRSLPTGLQAHIKEIVDTAFVRTDYVKSYEIGEPDERGEVLLKVRVEYKVRNYSDLRKDYAPLIQEEAFRKPQFTYLEYSLGNKRYNYDAAYLSEHTTIKPDTNVHEMIGPHKVKLAPTSQDDKAVCQVIWTYEMTMPKEYTDTTYFGGATIGVTLHLIHAPDELDFFSSGEGMIHRAGSRSWYFNEPFITGQHVNVWWFLRKQSVSQTSTGQP